MLKHAIPMHRIKGHDMGSSGADGARSRNGYTGLDESEGFLREVVSQRDLEGKAGVKPHEDRVEYSKGALGRRTGEK